MILNILSNHQRAKLDSSVDTIFYNSPRFVYHVDQQFRNKLTALYSEYIAPDSVILDFMSSWISYLPNRTFSKVIGHGLNEAELQANKQLNEYWIQDINVIQDLQISSNSIDYCLVVAGWQYLQYPEHIASELYRITKPGGSIIVSFTNRAFWSKSPNIWLESTDQQRIEYVVSILSSQGWNTKSIINENTRSNNLLGIFRNQSDPFYSIISIKPDLINS